MTHSPDQAKNKKRGELAWIAEIRRRSLQWQRNPGIAAGQRRGDTPPAVTLGIGDDCAILSPRRNEEVLVTTDLFLEGRHFRRDWHSPESAGHRCLARGLSDIAAMGGRPLAAFLSLALPREENTAWVDAFLSGLLRLAERFDCVLAGGDTSQAPGAELLADIVLVGAVPRGRALRRSGASLGDRLVVTGALGGAAAELETMGGRGAPEANPTGDTVRLHPQSFPEPRIEVGRALLRRGLTSAAMDLSDGLSTDLRHLCEASGVRAQVDARSLPLHPLAEGQRGLALNGGEDYELLFTVPAGKELPKQIAGVALTVIGEILPPDAEMPLVTLRDEQGVKPLDAGGWEHLRGC